MQQKLYWLDYDPVALAVLVIGMGMIGVLVLSGGGPDLSGLPSERAPTTAGKRKPQREPGLLGTNKESPVTRLAHDTIPRHNSRKARDRDRDSSL